MRSFSFRLKTNNNDVCVKTAAATPERTACYVSLWNKTGSLRIVVKSLQ